ncbi:MAG: M15 family metallopeptidase [Turicibacter sp.]|nr:M15 family metallopeptidase [Turicibacter sp.]
MRKFRNFILTVGTLVAMGYAGGNFIGNVRVADGLVVPSPVPVPVTEVPETPSPFQPDPFYENIRLVENPSDLLVLVNKSRQLSWDFQPADLRPINVLGNYNQPAYDLWMREDAATALEEMFQAAADEAGLLLWARSTYRSYFTQESIYHGMVLDKGVEEADRWSARPGHSEHQTGLALDISSASIGGALEQRFGDVPEGIWLRENAHRFGFIIRYPYGREAETGFAYEPWHVRFVGIDAASDIFENKWILEEYLHGI